MGHVVIGIHGLAKKPAPHLLSAGWQSAMLEGLEKNADVFADEDSFEYVSVYWADLLHETDANADLYKPASVSELKTYKQCKSWWRREIHDIFTGSEEKLEDQIESMRESFGAHHVADAFFKILVKDLGKYYGDENLKNAIRKRLKDQIIAHKDKKIMLVAHSMGSIIAYDVLRELGKNEPVSINQFVTIGSPLGVPHVKLKIEDEFLRARTPSIVKYWANFADRRDPVAISAKLEDDYEANSDRISVKDIPVCNDWIVKNKKIQWHHKSYGYLRTPEFSELLANFI